MKELYVKVKEKTNTRVVLDVFRHVQGTKREIVNQELNIYLNDNGKLETWLGPTEYKAFLCLHCGTLEYHINGNGHIYPLCSMCANTEKTFNRYFQLDSKREDYELKPEYMKKVDKGE